MIPLRDRIPTRRRPVVTMALILINVVIFVFSIAQPSRTLGRADGDGRVTVSGFDAITLEYGFKPCELQSECPHPGRGEALPLGATDADDAVEVRIPHVSALFTLLSAMFMHGGWLHLIGNMLFLWIFGNNVEDAMHRGLYLAYYLLCGLAASLTQFAIDTASDVPNIGASGAIAGVLGGYLLLYPRARVLTVVPLLVFFYVVEIPAVLVLATWFGLQLLDGSAALAAPGESFGVAYFAHIGGFVAGFALVRLVATRRLRRVPGAGYA